MLNPRRIQMMHRYSMAVTRLTQSFAGLLDQFNEDDIELILLIGHLRQDFAAQDQNVHDIRCLS